jgi:integrase
MLGGLRDELLAHLDWQRSTGLDAEGFVFTNQDGVMLRPWTFTRRDLERTARAAGIVKPVTLYSLRHTFATLHVAAGTPLKVVSRRARARDNPADRRHVHARRPGGHGEWMQRFERKLDEAAVPALSPLN